MKTLQNPYHISALGFVGERDWSNPWQRIEQRKYIVHDICKIFVNCNLLKIKIERWESKYGPVECFIWGQAVFSFLQQHPQPKPSQDCPATKACLSWLDIFIIIIIYIFRQSTFLLVGLYLSLSFCVIMRRENFRVHKLQLTYWS